MIVVLSYGLLWGLTASWGIWDVTEDYYRLAVKVRGGTSEGPDHLVERLTTGRLRIKDSGERHDSVATGTATCFAPFLVRIHFESKYTPKPGIPMAMLIAADEFDVTYLWVFGLKWKISEKVGDAAFRVLKQGAGR